MKKNSCSTGYFTPNIVDNGFAIIAEEEKCDA